MPVQGPAFHAPRHLRRQAGALSPPRCSTGPRAAEQSAKHVPVEVPERGMPAADPARAVRGAPTPGAAVGAEGETAAKLREWEVSLQGVNVHRVQVTKRAET